MRTLIFVLVVIFTVNNSTAQVIGKIFDKDYADEEFGQVLSSVAVENSELNEMLKISGEYIMLNICTGDLRAVDEKRDVIKGEVISKEEVFYRMSTSQVELLLAKGTEKTTKIEMRPKTLTLTNGAYTLEMVDPCPPFCD